MKLLLVGSTGLVGSEVLKLALHDRRVREVVVLTRRALSVQHPRLQTRVVDFDALPDEPNLWQADAVICTLGTTMRAAGSKEAFRRVDYTYPLTIAKKAREHHTRTYVLNSAAGASPDSRFFYSQVKGELERDLIAMKFTSLSLIRPGLIAGERNEFRPGESALAVVLGFLEPLLPLRWRLNPAPHIARALLEAAVQQPSGTHIVASQHLV